MLTSSPVDFRLSDNTTMTDATNAAFGIPKDAFDMYTGTSVDFRLSDYLTITDDTDVISASTNKYIGNILPDKDEKHRMHKLNPGVINMYSNITNKEAMSVVLEQSNKQGFKNDRLFVTRSRLPSNTRVRLTADTQLRYRFSESDTVITTDSTGNEDIVPDPNKLDLFVSDLEDIVRNVGKTHQKESPLSITWPSGHQLLQSKRRVLRRSDESNPFLNRLHSKLLAENEESFIWPDNSIVRPKPLALAGIRYRGVSTEDSCGLETDMGNWSENDDDYAMNVHRHSERKCEEKYLKEIHSATKEMHKCLRCRKEDQEIMFSCGHKLVCNACAVLIDYCVYCDRKTTSRILINK